METCKEIVLVPEKQEFITRCYLVVGGVTELCKLLDGSGENASYGSCHKSFSQMKAFDKMFMFLLYVQFPRGATKCWCEINKAKIPNHIRVLNSIAIRKIKKKINFIKASH